MVRAGPKMELIKNDKARNLSFKRRKNTMKKKLDELSTLCDVEALMVVYGPNNQSDKPAEPELWPINPRVRVRQLFNKYMNQSRDDCKKRIVDLSHYFEERKRKAYFELEKLRRKTNEEWPTLEKQIDYLGKEKLGEFSSLLENRIAAAKARFDLVANNHNHTSNAQKLYKSNSSEEVCYPQPLSVIYPQEPLVCYPPPIAAIYPQQPVDYNQLQQPPSDYNQLQQQRQQQQHGLGASFGTNLTPNSRAMVLWNNNDCPAACGNNIVYAPLNSVPVFYGPMTSGMVNRSTRASQICYYYGAPAVQQPVPQNYVQYPIITRARAAAAAAAAAAASYQMRASEQYY